MALPSATDVEYIGTNGSGGMCLGSSTSELISFHGVAPCDQSATAAALSTTAAVTVSGTLVYGFATAAQLEAVATAVNLIRTCLREKGLMA